MIGTDFGQILGAWARAERSVKALVLIGSRVREPGDLVWSADAHSDWDFQVITSNPAMFSSPAWLRTLPCGEPDIYVSRMAVLNPTPKINMLFAGQEAEMVVISAGRAALMKWLVRLGLHLRSVGFRQKLQGFAAANRPGWRFLKGAEQWESVYQRIVADIPDPRLSDDDVRRLASGFVCDYWGIRGKIGRRELRSAQRLIHRDLAEVNFMLLHELRLREEKRTFPDARRLERITPDVPLSYVTIDARPEAESLFAATETAALGLRELVSSLVGSSWRWPESYLERSKN